MEFHLASFNGNTSFKHRLEFCNIRLTENKLKTSSVIYLGASPRGIEKKSTFNFDASVEALKSRLSSKIFKKRRPWVFAFFVSTGYLAIINCYI